MSGCPKYWAVMVTWTTLKSQLDIRTVVDLNSMKHNRKRHFVIFVIKLNDKSM